MRLYCNLHDYAYCALRMASPAGSKVVVSDSNLNDVFFQRFSGDLHSRKTFVYFDACVPWIGARDLAGPIYSRYSKAIPALSNTQLSRQAIHYSLGSHQRHPKLQQFIALLRP